MGNSGGNEEEHKINANKDSNCKACQILVEVDCAHLLSGQQGCDLLWFSCNGVRILQLVVCFG